MKWPFVKNPPPTRQEKASAAASDLAKHAAQLRRERRSEHIAKHLAEIAASPPSPIAPREQVVAGVRR